MPKKPRVELAINRIRRRLRVGIVGNDDEVLRLFSRLTGGDELGPYLRTLAEDYMNLRVSHLAQDEANALELALIQLKRSHQYDEPCHIEKWRSLRAKRRSRQELNVIRMPGNGIVA
jgi:hypothetical protein